MVTIQLTVLYVDSHVDMDMDSMTSSRQSVLASQDGRMIKSASKPRPEAIIIIIIIA